MEILEKGTKIPPNKRVYVIKCRTCGCKFTYQEEDMRYLTIDTKCVFCPQCRYANVPIIKRRYRGVKNGSK